MSFYDDASLIFLAGAAAGKDGKVYNVKPVPVYGPELVTNGDFATDSDWNKGSGWSINTTTKSLDFTNVSSYTYQGIGTIQNKKYEVVIDLEVTSGSVIVKSFNAQNIFTVNVSGRQTLTGHFTESDSNTNFGFQASGSASGKVYSVSVKEISNDADFDFSRGSNLSATRVGPDGLIEKGRENLLTQNNTFSSSNWAKFNASVTSGQSGYDGSSDAWKWNETATAGEHQLKQAFAQSGVNCLSIYAKAAERDVILFRMNLSSSWTNVFFNLTSGSVVSTGGFVDATITSVGNGWYRCEAVFNNLTGSTIQYQLGLNNTTFSYTGESGKGIFIQNAQLEIGLAATEVISTGASTGKAGLLEDEPRFDYSGGVTCPSLLKEKQRTNKITNSEYINTTTFNQNNLISISNNYATSPEGLQNAAKIIPTAVSGYHQLRTTLATPNGYDIISCFVKASGYNYVQLASWADPANYVNFDLTDGSIGSVGVNGPSIKDIEDYGNGWYRIHANVQASGGGLIGIGIVTSASAGWAQSFTGNGTDGILVWGAQAEQGSYPTSYIPNHSGGTITRSDELANYVTVGGGSEKWSLMYEFDFNKTPLQQNEIFSIIRNTANNVAITFRHFIRDSVKHVISPYFNLEPAYPFGSAGASSVTDSSVLLRANGDGSYDYFASLNGVVTKASVTGMSNIAFDKIDLGAGASTAHKKVILFANTLSDADCTALIGTSYDTFADMAEALNYTVYE